MYIVRHGQVVKARGHKGKPHGAKPNGGGRHRAALAGIVLGVAVLAGTGAIAMTKQPGLTLDQQMAAADMVIQPVQHQSVLRITLRWAIITVGVVGNCAMGRNALSI